MNRNISSKKIIWMFGDIMVDTYHYGSVKRLAPEYPIPVQQYERTVRILGGMGNVALNLETWRYPCHENGDSTFFNDYEIHLFGKYCPDDDAGLWLKEQSSLRDGLHFHLFPMTSRTTEKIRFVTPSNEILFRHDREDNTFLQESQVDTVLNYCKKLDNIPQVIVFSDYHKGFLPEQLIRSLLEMYPHATFCVDGKKDFKKFKNCQFIKGNIVEFSQFLGCAINPCDTDGFQNIHSKFQEELECQYSLLTLGKSGLTLSHSKNIYNSNISKPERISDVTGCGDIILACMVWGFVQNIIPKDVSSYLSFCERCAVWNVNSFGTSVIPLKTFYLSFFEHYSEMYSFKLLGWDYFPLLRPFSTIVFTNGCFDLLHGGHLSLLRSAKSLGTVLVVGLNTDDSVRENKGLDRPILSYETRKQNLLSLEWIDIVIPLEEKTPLEMLKKIHPHVLIKGGDYTPENVIGKEYADKLILYDFKEGMSSTKIIERVLKSGNNS